MDERQDVPTADGNKDERTDRRTDGQKYRKRQSDGQKNRQTERDMRPSQAVRVGQTEAGETDRQTKTGRQADRQTGKSDTQTNRQAKQSDMSTGRETCIHSDRQSDRQNNIKTIHHIFYHISGKQDILHKVNSDKTIYLFHYLVA